MRATLNAVTPAELRSIDHKRLETTSRHTREQLTRAGDLGQFGLDIERDLLRAVTGAPIDKKYGSRLSGSDSLTVVADIPFPKLAERLAVYSALAELGAYKSTFPWVDNIMDVRDPALEALLDKQLAAELVAGNDNIWLSPPDIIDWEETAGFRFGSARRGEIYADLTLSEYYLACGGPADLQNGQRLQHDRIFHIRGEDDTGQHSWPVLRCLVGEIQYAGGTYVLNEGIWYRVDRDFLDDLDAFVSAVPKGTVALPEYDDKNESAYNTRAHKQSKSTFALLDRDLIHLPKRGAIEVCDLYSKDKVFVHVKRMSGSSNLSHLFAQGLVSAQLFLNEESYRDQFLEKIPQFAWGKASDAVVASQFGVCYAIIQRPKKPLSLPFFSKVSVRSAVQNIRQLGMAATLVGIPSLKSK